MSAKIPQNLIMFYEILQLLFSLFYSFNLNLFVCLVVNNDILVLFCFARFSSFFFATLFSSWDAFLNNHDLIWPPQRKLERIEFLGTILSWWTFSLIAFIITCCFYSSLFIIIVSSFYFNQVYLIYGIIMVH